MTRPLSNDLRKRVVAAVAGGESCRAVAARFGVAVSSVVKWSQRCRATGSVAPGKMGGHRKPVLEPHRAFIVERLRQTPHLTLHGLKDELAARGVKVSHNAVWLFLPREGLRFKKTLFALEQARARTQAATLAILAGQPRSASTGVHRRDPRVRGGRLWIKTNMAPLRGWGPKGERVPASAPHGHWRTLTFLGALRCDRLTAPCVFDGPIDGECFRACVEQQLVPTLKPGEIVIMDNLGSHKAAALRQIIRAAGARLWYLRPCSPDLNLIEQAFLKIKHYMRAAQQRSVDDTWRRVGSLVATIGAAECDNYFVNAGYASVKT